MHIVLGILGTIVTILILVHRLSDAGIDLGWLNPFLWKRRRDFKRLYEQEPALNLDSPMEAVALLLFATAKLDGEISSDEKNSLIDMFESNFKLTHADAKGLLSSSAHLYQDGTAVLKNPKAVLYKSQDQFTPEQIRSTLDMLKQVSHLHDEPTVEQAQLIANIESCFAKQRENW